MEIKGGAVLAGGPSTERVPPSVLGRVERRPGRSVEQRDLALEMTLSALGRVYSRVQERSAKDAMAVESTGDDTTSESQHIVEYKDGLEEKEALLKDLNELPVEEQMGRQTLAKLEQENAKSVEAFLASGIPSSEGYEDIASSIHQLQVMIHELESKAGELTENEMTELHKARRVLKKTVRETVERYYKEALAGLEAHYRELSEEYAARLKELDADPEVSEGLRRRERELIQHELTALSVKIQSLAEAVNGAEAVLTRNVQYAEDLVEVVDYMARENGQLSAEDVKKELDERGDAIKQVRTGLKVAAQRGDVKPWEIAPWINRDVPIGAMDYRDVSDRFEDVLAEAKKLGLDVGDEEELRSLQKYVTSRWELLRRLANSKFVKSLFKEYRDWEKEYKQVINEGLPQGPDTEKFKRAPGALVVSRVVEGYRDGVRRQVKEWAILKVSLQLDPKDGKVTISEVLLGDDSWNELIGKEFPIRAVHGRQEMDPRNLGFVVEGGTAAEYLKVRQNSRRNKKRGR